MGLRCFTLLMVLLLHGKYPSYPILTLPRIRPPPPPPRPLLNPKQPPTNLSQGCLCSTTGPMLVSFMALSGFLGSACLANIAGTIFDTFGNVHGSAYALAFFVLSSNVGPSVGSPLGQYITQRWGANWIFINMMVAGFALAVICCVVPETRPRFAIAQNCDPEDVPVEDRRVLTQDMVGTGAEIWGLTTLVLRLMVSQ